MKFGRNKESVVAQNSHVGSIQSRSVHRRLQVKPKTCSFFVITKMYHNPNYIQRISTLPVATHKSPGTGRELCCRETFRYFLTWAKPEQKNGGLSGVLRTAYRQCFPANQYSTDGKPIFRRHIFLGVNPPGINNSKRGNPNQKMSAGNHYIHPVENFQNSIMKSFLKSKHNGRCIVRKFRALAALGRVFNI